MLEKISQRDGLWWPNSDQGGWDYTTRIAPNVPMELLRFVAKKDVVVQAGGNCGQYIRQYAQNFKTVYTFEPDPLNFFCLNLNCQLDNVIKFQACVGYERTLINLNVNDHDTSATHIAPDQVGNIPTLRIDDLNLQDCDLIQLDTEGYEYFGVLGAENTIDKFKPVLCIEWYAPWAQRYGVDLQMLEDFIAKWNYVLVGVDVSDRIYKVK